MDKATFDVIMKFYLVESDAEKVLDEKGLSIDDVEEALAPFMDCREQLLRIGKYLDEEEYVNKDTYIKDDYENIKKHIRMHVIYEYQNGMALCETTSGLFYLVPKELLAD